MNLYKTISAAEFINAEIPKSLEYWLYFLINNRKLTRNPAFRIPYSKVKGNIVYSEKELLHFIEWEKYRKILSIERSRYSYLHKATFDLNNSTK
jgi:hypothetical protein